MIEKVIELFMRLVIAMEALAKTMEAARILTSTGHPLSGAPAGTGTTAAAAPAPAGTGTTAAAPVDDMGLGEAAPAHTKESVATLARAKAAQEGKGRPFVKECLKAIGCEALPDVKPEQYAKFVELLNK